MSIRINLLPAAERRVNWPLKSFFVFSGLTVLALLSAVYGYCLFYTLDMDNQLSDLHNQYQLLKPTESTMTAASGKLQMIKTKEDMLAQLTKERAVFTPVFTRVAYRITPNVWLTSLDIDSKKSEVRLQGMARSYNDSAAFLKNLEQDEVLKDPVLKKVERSNQPQLSNYFTFEILLNAKGVK